MRSRLFAVGGLVALLATTTPMIVRAQTGTLDPSIPTPAPTAPVKQGRHARREKHPELLKAMKALERAKSDLTHADRDFGGHRARALELTDQALQEIQQAIQFDKE